MIDDNHAVQNGIQPVRIWQSNIGQQIVAYVPVSNGSPVEAGQFQEDGVTFAAAEIVLEFIDDGQPSTALLTTGNIVDRLHVPGVGPIEATLVTAGNPTVFIDAAAIGLSGAEMPMQINADPALLARCEAIRAYAAVVMGLAPDMTSATRDRPATPKLSWLAAPATYQNSAGETVAAEQIDVLARILSMGKLHHAFTGTGSIALAVAAALPGSIAARVIAVVPGAASPLQAQSRDDEKTPAQLRIGHVSGRLAIGATVRHDAAGWRMEKAILSRSARVIMSGWVHCP